MSLANNHRACDLMRLDGGKLKLSHGRNIIFFSLFLTIIFYLFLIFFISEYFIYVHSEL